MGQDRNCHRKSCLINCWLLLHVLKSPCAIQVHTVKCKVDDSFVATYKNIYLKKSNYDPLLSQYHSTADTIDTNVLLMLINTCSIKPAYMQLFQDKYSPITLSSLIQGFPFSLTTLQRCVKQLKLTPAYIFHD